MATFLVTPKMNPELRARVERAVSNRARAKHHAAELGGAPFEGKTSMRPLMLLPVLALAAVVGLGVLMVRRERQALETERAELLTEIESNRVGLPPGHENLIQDTEKFVVEASAEGETVELVDATLTVSGALDKALARPLLYVHAPASELRDGKLLDDAIRSSDKDAFLVCMVHPPASTSERDLLGKVRGVYFAGAKVDDETSNVRRLADARQGLGVLSAAFEASVRAAEDRNSMKRLRREMQKAPLMQAKKAAMAEVLLVIADSKNGSRVTLVDLGTKKTLLRVHRRAQPQAWSEKAFIHHEEMEACSVAVAVRGAVNVQ